MLPLQFSIQTVNAAGDLTTLSSSTQATEAYLNQIVKAFIHALHNKSFNPDAHPWHHLSDNYELGSDSPSNLDSDEIYCPIPPVTGRERNMANLAKRCEKYPDWKDEFGEVSTEVHESGTKATSFSAMRANGEFLT